LTPAEPARILWRRFVKWWVDACPEHSSEPRRFCVECWRESGRRFDREERARKVRLIADGVKLAHEEMGK
jgi:hypothetical protein